MPAIQLPVCGINLYAYCGNNPVNYADPSGYCRNEDAPERDIINGYVDGTSRIIDTGRKAAFDGSKAADRFNQWVEAAGSLFFGGGGSGGGEASGGGEGGGGAAAGAEEAPSALRPITGLDDLLAHSPHGGPEHWEAVQMNAAEIINNGDSVLVNKRFPGTNFRPDITVIDSATGRPSGVVEVIDSSEPSAAKQAWLETNPGGLPPHIIRLR